MEKCNDIYLWLEEQSWLEKLEEFKTFIAFIKRNKVEIENYYKNFDSSSHTEGMISWFIKSILGYAKNIQLFDF
ncbi:hypothetical protein [Spiroplasma taiwanense]|nr:hypothetical protein [Spiroplasma taiwanense]